MSKKTDIWMPLFIADYLADTSRLTTEQHGAYLLLIMDYWRQGPLPNDPAILAQIARMSVDAWGHAQAMLMHFFSIGADGRLHHKRVDAELAAAAENQQRSAGRAKKASDARWGRLSDSSSTPQAMLEQCPSPSPSPVVKKPSRNKRGGDVRHAPCKAAVGRYAERTKVVSIWGPAEGKQLANLLRAAPNLTVEQFEHCLDS